MDPNELLRVLRNWAQEVVDLDELTEEKEAAERFQTLDQWLSRGGFHPRDWQANR